MINIIITGANQGIGYYFTEENLKNGNRVAVLDVETNNLEQLKHIYPNNLFYYQADIGNDQEIEEAINDLVSKFETIDVLVHNACVCTFKNEEETNLEEYQNVFDINYFGALRLVKAVMPIMKKQKCGKVIFTSSGVGVTGFIGISPYASSKGALESLAKCLNLEYEKDNISFHLFHPPLTNTKSSSPLPVPNEFKADPIKVGVGLAKNMNSKRFIIYHSPMQKLQTLACYLFPIKMGRLLSKMTSNYQGETENAS